MSDKTEDLRELVREVVDDPTVTETQKETPSHDPGTADATDREAASPTGWDGLDDALEGASGDDADASR